MDARIDVNALFGLELGDAHVIRNAGGLATSDAIRSLAASQRLLGTEEIVVIQHTDCGIHKVAPDEFAAQVAAETGRDPGWTVEATSEPRTTLEITLETLRDAAELPHRDRIQGWVLDLQSGRLLETSS
jgi:carbonic anhydrase